jgi:hypothetical protein
MAARYHEPSVLDRRELDYHRHLSLAGTVCARGVQ